MSFNCQVRFGLCKQHANYAFSHRAGCEQHLPTARCGRLACLRSARRAAKLWGKVHQCHPRAVSPQKASCMPASPSLPPHLSRSPSLLTSQNSPMKGLVTSSVSCFFHPLLIPLPPLFLCNFHLPCLVFPRSQSIVTVLPPPLEAAGLTGRGEAQEAQRPACTSCQDRKGGGVGKQNKQKWIVKEKVGREES